MTDADNGNKGLSTGTCQSLAKRPAAYPGEEETISLEEAAGRCAIEPKRFLGHAMTPGFDRPIGDGQWFYVSSVEKLAKRLRAADRETGANE